jgi:putative methanogen marker protein 4
MGKYMINYDNLLNWALEKECKIGIGQNTINETVKISIKKCHSLGFNSIQTYSESKQLLDDLSNQKINCAVRGTLPAKIIMNDIKSKFNIDNLIRVALLQTANKKMFILAPVGIDEGTTIDYKLEIIKYAVKWLGLFNIKAKIAILSGGRKDDVGRWEGVDKTISEARELEDKLRSSKLDIKNFGICLEDAIEFSNIVIVPDGIIGNYIFRTLYHLGQGDSIGAPILNIPEIFIDTSRTKHDYCSAMVLAAANYNLKSKLGSK